MSDGLPPIHGFSYLFLEVAEIEPWQRHLASSGVRCGEVESVPGGRVIRFSDPDGNELEVHQPV